ncbi:replication initiation protein [Campylobacter fetus subsp. venerealis]|uniref:RepB family plasmid replication initiator protein n=1 Tax=Campylobacter fetus TaxID=196 RepID=UPI00190A7333|nr:RepB family plasmid replication initiator protein [Campylobacter fetus]MBK3505329.1 replication initiation protein [Campylobacter fetus subsp. venerealis]
MKKEIVKYHNDLNRISIGKLNALEQNLLFKILTQIKNYYEINKNIIWLPIYDFRDLDKDYRLGNEDFYELLKSLKEKFFKLDFTKPSRKAPSFSYGDIRLSQKN